MARSKVTNEGGQNAIQNRIKAVANKPNANGFNADPTRVQRKLALNLLNCKLVAIWLQIRSKLLS